METAQATLASDRQGEFKGGSTMFGSFVVRGRDYAAAVSMVAAIFVAGACDPPPPPPPPTTATVITSTNFPAGGALECNGNATWIYVPQALTGSGGVANTVTQPESYEHVIPDRGLCTYSYTAFNLRVGTWLVEVSAGTASGSCTATLHAGTNLVAFNYGTLGCTTGW